MSDNPEELKAQIKKLSAQAMTWKMNLHDLSEELPVNWENIAAETPGGLTIRIAAATARNFSVLSVSSVSSVAKAFQP